LHYTDYLKLTRCNSPIFDLVKKATGTLRAVSAFEIDGSLAKMLFDTLPRVHPGTKVCKKNGKECEHRNTTVIQ
jgi:hypothetical protein